MNGSRDLQPYDSLVSRGKYFRLNVELEGPEPQLDDVDSIPAMLSTELETPQTLDIIDSIIECAMASQFYFELDSLPKFVKGDYVGTGSIFCKLNATEAGYSEFMDKIKGIQIFIDGNMAQFTRCGGDFCLRLKLKVKKEFAVQIQIDLFSKPCHISGSPFAIPNLEKEQALTSPPS
jgi:hypothetical protein